MRNGVHQLWPQPPKDVLDIFSVDQPWKHQVDGVRGVLRELQSKQSMTLCCPTGGGKTIMMQAWVKFCARWGIPVALYTNRKMLTQQTARSLKENKFEFGVRAASMPYDLDMTKPIQISSMQTEIARCLDTKRWNLHKAGLVLVDEAHLQATGQSLKVIQKHLAQGAKVVLVTATPLGLSHITPNLLVAGNNKELRECGALVPAIVKHLRSMDLSKVKRVLQKFEYESLIKHCWSQAIVGDIYDEWCRFNPDRRMTLGFAPGVPESRTLARHFANNGVSAAHIDSTEVWVDGKFIKDDSEGKQRNKVLNRWKSGEIEVLWNCQVFREGIDCVDLYHLILASPIGQLKDYVQTVGRVLRRSDATPDNVLITDHGGSIWQHGSPNQSIDWHELYALDDKEIQEKQDKKREEKEQEELAAPCPNCGTVVGPGGRCPPPPLGCGEKIEITNPQKFRFVRQESGELVEMSDSDIRPRKRKPSTASAEQKRWNAIFFPSRKSTSNRAMTFKQAAEAYRRRHGERLPKNLGFTPVDPDDWSRKIRDVPMRDLKNCN